MRKQQKQPNMILGVSKLSSLRRSRSKRNMTNLKRSSSTGSSQAPLLVAKQPHLPITRPCFIRRALATATNLRHHPSAVADSPTSTNLEKHHPAESHGCARLHQHSSPTTSSSSCSSDNMSIYTSGSSRNVKALPRACCEEQKRIVTHPPTTHPFDEDSNVMRLVTKHCETDFTSIEENAQEAESEEQERIVTSTPSPQPFDEDPTAMLLASQHCNSPDRLGPVFAFIEENVQEAVSEYEDPTFVPEDSTVEESLAEPFRALVGKEQPAAPSQKPPVHPSQQSSKMLGTKDLNSVDEQFALGLKLLDKAKCLLSNDCRGEEALQMFRQAVLLFEPAITQKQQQACTSHALAVVGLLHSARCHRYMSSIVTDAHDAVCLLHAVVRLYEVARERVETIVESNIISEEAAASTNTIGRQAAKPATRVCLDTMIMETLQFQADVLIKRLGDYEQAVVCYEEILRQLLYLEEVRGWDGALERSILLDDINFVFMSREKHTDALRESLSVLMGYYGTLPPLDESFSFVVCEDALNLLRIRQEEDYSEDDKMIGTVASLYKQLSEIYMSRQESDRAVLALRDFAVVKLTASGEPSSEALQVIEKMGKTYEQMENYSDALECYELALLCRCRYYGNTNVSVARALVNVARMKELQDGNTDESVNLYRAANAIFSLHVKADNIQTTNAYKVMPVNLKPLRSPSPSEHNNSQNIESTASTSVAEQSSVSSMDPPGVYSGPSPKKGAASVAVKSQPEDDESDDEDSDVKLMELPFLYAGYIQNEGDDVRTVFSSDNDIVTLASTSVATCSSRTTPSSRSLEQSDIVSMDPGTNSAVGWRGESPHEKEKSLDRAVPPGNDEAAAPIGRPSTPPEFRSRPFTKIFSLADTLKRMQQARQAARERKGRDPPPRRSSSTGPAAGANRPKQESDTGNSRGATREGRALLQVAPKSVESNQLDLPLLPRRAELQWI